MIKKLLVFAACLLVSIVGTVSILFFATEMSFGFPEVKELEIKSGKCSMSIRENETLNILVFSRSDVMPIVKQREKIVSFDEQECLEVKDQSFQVQTQNSSGDYLSGLALFSFAWSCVDAGNVEFSVDEDFFVKNGYFVGAQEGYGGFFFNVFIAIAVSMIMSLILYKVVTRGLKNGSNV
jgi:hypothetical protein